MVTDRTTTPGALEQDIREKFRSSGYTLTSQRRAVLEALKEARGHPSAEDIYLIVKKKNPRVALGTRYDLNVEPHLDIRCARCGEVSEIPGVRLGELEEHIRNNTPYEVTRATLVIEGLCPACRVG